MAKKIHAFRTGKPCSHFAIRFDRPVMDPILTRDAIVWCSEHVAPTDRVDSICVLNIRTWCFRKLRGDAREEVRSFIASDEIVALMTHTNMCYVWELHGDGFKKFRVPSQDYFKCTTCRDRTVACAAVSAEKTSVYIWNFDTSLGQSFEVESSRQLPMAGYRDRVIFTSSRANAFLDKSTRLLLQPKTYSIIIINHAWALQYEVRGQQYIHYGPIVSSRFRYDGVHMDRCHLSDIQCEHPGWVILISEQNPQPLKLVPIDERGRFSLEVGKEWLGFDEHENKFKPFSKRSWTQSSKNWYNSTFYRLCYRTGRRDDRSGVPGFTVGHANKTKCTLFTKPKPRVHSRSGDHSIESRAGVEYKQLMNFGYVVSYCRDEIFVYCFDESDNRPLRDERFFTEGEFLPLEYVREESEQWVIDEEDELDKDEENDKDNSEEWP
ncbi:hypothetical protein NX059_006315 [Plenodomus lindquistii]|nr:hypothetical protein NX059_006315 [Plenodomus lindquistii]